jgi:hypothetical protein
VGACAAALRPLHGLNARVTGPMPLGMLARSIARRIEQRGRRIGPAERAIGSASISR